MTDKEMEAFKKTFYWLLKPYWDAIRDGKCFYPPDDKLDFQFSTRVFWFNSETNWWSTPLTMHRYAVHDGRLALCIVYQDRCGNVSWDGPSFHVNPEDPYSAERKASAYIDHEAKRSKKEYMQWVAETGLDPAYELLVATTVQKEQDWDVLVRVTQDGHAVKLVGAKWPVSREWMVPDELPMYLLTWCLVKWPIEGSDTLTTLLDPADLAELGFIKRLDSEYYSLGGHVEYSVSIPEPQVREKRRRIAHAFLSNSEPSKTIQNEKELA